MRAPRLIVFWGFLTGLTAGLARATPPSSVMEPVPLEDASQFAFRVTPPAPLLSSLPDGSTQIQLRGFAGKQVRAGVPDLPFQILRVAIPPGVTPRLEVTAASEYLVPGVSPASVPRHVATVPPRDPSEPVDLVRDGIRKNVSRFDLLEPDAAIYRGTHRWPEAVVALDHVGMFRDQRYVEIRINPVRLDPAIDGLSVLKSATITVRFDGDDGGRSAPSPSPQLEDVYRRMFVNYAQGTTFRTVSPSLGPLLASSTMLAPASGPIQKIKIRQNGVVRLDATRIGASGFAAQPLSTWKLANRGVEVPLEIHDVNGNDLLDAGDWVQFYGQALDDETKTVLNTDLGGTDQDIFEVNDFTDENVYFLTIEPGSRSRMSTEDGTATFTRTPAADFGAIAHAEVDDAFRPLGGNDPWYWSPALDSNPLSPPTLRTDTVPLPGLAPGATTAQVAVVVRGLTEDANLTPDHHTRVTLYNASSSPLAVNDDNGTFDGRTLYTHNFSWTFPGSGPALTNPVQVRLEARPITSGSHEVMLNYIEVGYRRSFQASGDVLTFDWPDGDAEFLLSGLTSSAPEVWELTGRVGATGVVNAVRVTGATIAGPGPFTARFRMDDNPSLPNGMPRRFVVFGAGAVAVPADADFQPDTVSDLRSTANQADMIVIAHPSVLGVASQGTLNQLLAWRSANQGISSKIAMIGDIYDEFNDGLPGPNAIQKFLAWVMSTNPGEGWANPKPAYVLLLGDGSYDFKAGTLDGSFVPTALMLKDDPSFGYYASDSQLAAVVGADPMPDLAIGRISTRTDLDTNAVLQKILAYEQSPAAGNWRKNSLVISDKGKDPQGVEALQFEATNDSALVFIKQPPDTSRRLRYWTDYCLVGPGGCTPSKANMIRADIKAVVNGSDGFSDGVSLIQFVGHGNFDVWSDDAFFDNRDDASGGTGPSGRDTDDLANGLNGPKLPFLVAHNCLTGGFMGSSAHSLGEDWNNRPSGGSVALFSPSGLSSSYFGQDASDLIWGDFFGGRKERVVSAATMDVYADVCGIHAYEPCQNYVLLGDPATQLDFPTVGPATHVIATPGNARVDLAWTASTTAGAVYDIWRSPPDQPAGVYTKAGAGVAGTTFADTNPPNGLTNAKTYYYYLVAIDPSGFESRWSHFNSDCAVSGPDCLSAKPLNPNPPSAPTGVIVTDPETGGKLNVSWTVPADPELGFYTVKWGTTSGVYTSTHNAGKNGFDTLQGLTNGQTYYIVVTKTSTSNLESAPSTEVSASPSFVRGLRSPDFISSLQIARSGANAVLTWGAVTTDIYGKTTTIASYEVYRGTTPTFVPAIANRVGTPTTATFTDFNALTTANPNYYYLVRAVDSSGNVGGLGNQLPNGIDALAIVKTPDGTGGTNLSFSWPAVTMDFDLAFPVVIDHYEVYGAATKFSRADIRNGTVPLIASPTTNAWSTPAPVTTRFYSVIAVDARGNKSSF